MNGPNKDRMDAFVNGLAGPVCDALVVVSEGEVILDWRSGRAEGPMETMSVTKSIVSMVVGRLFQTGLLHNLDMPLADTISDWRDTPKQAITLRHVMAHTSGLASPASADEVFVSGDVLAFARDAALETEPGAVFAYNNCAVNLLAAIVQHAAHRPLDEIAAELLFAPLGIQNWEWRRDAAGTPLVMSGCSLEPRDLARLGQLMAQNGTWKGEALLSPDWCRLSTAPALPESPADLHRHLRTHGLLWWILYPADEVFLIDEEVTAAWRTANPPIAADVLQMMERLSGRAYAKDDLLAAVADELSALTQGDREAAISVWHDATWRRGLPDGRRRSHSEIGFFAQGSLGQYVLVLPEQQRVIVQMVSSNATPGDPANLIAAAERLFFQ